MNFRIYLITDRHRTKGDIFETIEEALSEGIKAIQLREKDMPIREKIQWAVKLKALVDRYNAMLFINDRVDVAIAVDAQGVHLNKDSIPVDVVKKTWPHLIIGYSAHSLEEVLSVQDKGADFVTFSPVFETSSKPDAIPQGLTKLREVCQRAHIPVFGLGGITLTNALDVINAGAHGIAVVSAILGADSVREATKTLKRLVS